MAKEEKKDETEQPKKKNILKTIIILLLVVILLGGAGIGGLLYMKKQKVKEEQLAEEEHVPVVVKKEYYTMDKFITNLRSISETGETVDKFISLELSFEIKDDAKKEERKTFLKTYSPMIKDSLLMTINQFEEKELLSAEGKQKLSDSLKKDLNNFYKEQKKALAASEHKEDKEDKPEDLVERVLFTSFIIQ